MNLPGYPRNSDLDTEWKPSKTGNEKSSGSVSTALPGRKLATSKSPRLLKPFEIDLLRQDLKAALAYLRAARVGSPLDWHVGQGVAG